MYNHKQSLLPMNLSFYLNLVYMCKQTNRSNCIHFIFFFLPLISFKCITKGKQEYYNSYCRMPKHWSFICFYVNSIFFTFFPLCVPHCGIHFLCCVFLLLVEIRCKKWLIVIQITANIINSLFLSLSLSSLYIVLDLHSFFSSELLFLRLPKLLFFPGFRFHSMNYVSVDVA